ncbi:unnamed protein product [Ectocarpus sp. 12 AP-2014]
MEGDGGSAFVSPGRSRTSCVNALIVALNEMCDGSSWYTSTKELQLASLEICIACRTHRTMHLYVNRNIPRRLLAAADASPPHPKRLGRTRVPRLRARYVTWNMRTAESLKDPIFAMTGVDGLKFGDDFDGSLDAVAWPRRLKKIEFQWDSPFNQPIDMVDWPDSLQTLVFGVSFDQPIERVHFPASLQMLVFDVCFDQQIVGAFLPSSLQELDLGEEFNQPIEDVAWPLSLQKLRFGRNFNQPIERAKFPSSLQELTFHGFSRFDQPIEGVLWPDSLQVLIFGHCFNKPVDRARWPRSLQELSFGLCFELPGDKRMGIYSEFNQRICTSCWPASLRRLTLGHKFRQSLEGLGTWMPNLEALRVLDWRYGPGKDDSLLRGIKWPTSLRELTVYIDSNSDGVEIPSIVHVSRPDPMR